MAGVPLSDLNTPLGQDRPSRTGRPWARWIACGLAGSVGLVLVAIALVVAIRRDPDGGEPIATAAITAVKPQPNTPTPPETPVATAGRTQSSAAQMETEAGVTVMRPGSDAPGAIVITVPDSAEVKLAPSPDPRLVERSRYGALPKVAPNGATPLQIYARPLGPAPQVKPAGRIALLVGGLGISQNGTTDAIAKLPGPVSLAFAPYGAELERTVQRARGDGHEIFLQVPMEPFDYPDNDPGPHTLLAGAKANENIDHLQWALGRFTGYVGIVNFLGGRLTADEAALSTILREVAARGLMVVDDGSSSRSLMIPSAGRAQIPAIRIDRILDATPRADAIDKELERLEAMAREQGIAVGAASALPVSIERIARWSRTLEARNIIIVPVTAARGFRSPSTTGSLK